MTYDFKNIKEHYEKVTPRIFEQAKYKTGAWVSPYSRLVDWPSMFSPIEMQTWMGLRGFGHCPMYPQYPVLKYFVDFGNPVAKIAIECDGKEWHTDKEKDKNRDAELYKIGWTTYRISGSDCFRIEEKYYDLCYEEESDTWDILNNFYNTIEGLIKAIAIFHFGYKTFNRYVNEYDLAYKCVAKRISFMNTKEEEYFSEIINKNIRDLPKELKNQSTWA